MRHGVRGRKLGRRDDHRKALFRNQLVSLVRHERIRTTLTKAKELRPMAEKLLTLAKRKGTPEQLLHARRLAISRILDRDAVKKLFDVLAPRFQERPGGYTRILKLGKMRKGDNAEVAILEFVDFVFEAKEKKAEAKKAAAKKPDAKAADEKGEAKAAPKKEKAPKAEGEKKPAAGSKKPAPKKEADSKEKADRPAKKAKDKK